MSEGGEWMENSLTSDEGRVLILVNSFSDAGRGVRCVNSMRCC